MKKHLIIIDLYANSEISSRNVENLIKSILDQGDRDFRLILAGNADDESMEMLINSGVEFNQKNQGVDFVNDEIRKFPGEYILYIDAIQNDLSLKKACLQTFGIAAARNPEAGLFYADYDLDNGEEIKEIKLLFHHVGRVRDNQDYGKVFYLKKKYLEKIGYFDEKIKFNLWYDSRLKISEHSKLIRIANKYSGSLYTINAQASTTNVFDYLLAGKEVQLEAEEIVTNHLKRIGAYLEPGLFIERPVLPKQESKLDASVIIPVGHRPEFIGTAIESIQAQTHKNIEAIIMVNGGDKDPTADEVRKYLKGGDLYDSSKPEIRLEVIDINNIGLCLNIGAQKARGKYYIQLDSDDRLKSDAVEKVLDVFKSDPNIGMVIGSYEVWEKRDDGKLYRMDEIPVVTHDEWTEENGRNNLLRINGAGAPRCIPISVIKQMAYFSINDDAYARNYGEDYEMVNKIAEYYKIGRIYDPIYEVVRHDGGTDHAISQDLIDRNDEAKDDMRKEAILRRIKYKV